ncbi:MAG TPA: hypothetical protein VGL81_24730 [Polyangiaceae bacterium]
MGLQAFAVCVVAGVVTGALALGCGSSKSAGDDPGDDSEDASSDAGSSGGDSGTAAGEGGLGDAALGADAYPAFTPEMPQVETQKGPVLPTPKIVTVTFAGDPQATAIDAFDDALGASSYWKVLEEYGVGPTTSVAADHVVVQTPLTTGIDTDDIDTWVQSQITGAPGDGWPVPDTSTIYVVYVPTTVMPTYQGADACEGGDGYHYELDSPTNANGVSYAQILEGCYLDDELPLLTDLFETASHEIAEGSTDPYPNNAPAYYGFDTNHISWELWNDWQDELADACEYFDEGYFQGGSDLPYWLSRLWSNESAKAGHDPCVPVPSGVYNSVSPLGLANVSVSALDANGGVSKFNTKGWRIGVGDTATVQVGFWSDGPEDAWSVTAVEGDCCTYPWTDVLTVTPKTFSGKNGDTVSLKIKVNKAPAQGTAALLQFVSAAGGNISHYMPVIVGAY